VKLNKINSTENGVKGSVHTVQEDMVTLIATKATNKPLKKKRRTQFKEEDDEAFRRRNFPKNHLHGLNTSRMRMAINTRYLTPKTLKERHFITAIHLIIATMLNGIHMPQQTSLFVRNSRGSRTKMVPQHLILRKPMRTKLLKNMQIVMMEMMTNRSRL